MFLIHGDVLSQIAERRLFTLTNLLMLSDGELVLKILHSEKCFCVPGKLLVCLFKAKLKIFSSKPKTQKVFFIHVGFR